MTPSSRERRDAIVELYRHAARRHDRSTRRFEDLRQHAVEALQLRRRERVIDVACGTGAALEALAAGVGPHGSVVGVDASPQMLRVARQRIAAAGRPNVTLVEGLVEHASLGPPADAALFVLAHDVLQSDQALANVFRHLRPGARVAAAGPKTGAAWNLPARMVLRGHARRFQLHHDGLEAPWRLLAARLVEFEVLGRASGTEFVAWGKAP